MSYSVNEPNVRTVTDALEAVNADQLKKLLKLLPTPERPTRKAELVDIVRRHLEGETLQELWRKLDRIEQAAIAEAVHATGGRFLDMKFKAKYGESPSWGKI